MNLVMEIANIAQLSRVLSQIGQLPNVVEARRKM
jgi:(p)ppGpp synthase/HD superfamily hydrolase